jgi:hypothetical protein
LLEGTEGIRSYFSRLPNSGNAVKIGDRRVVALATNATLVTGFYDFTLHVNGQAVPLPARFTMILVKRGTTWLIFHHHSSQLPKPPQ